MLFACVCKPVVPISQLVPLSFVLCLTLHFQLCLCEKHFHRLHKKVGLSLVAHYFTSIQIKPVILVNKQQGILPFKAEN